MPRYPCFSFNQPCLAGLRCTVKINDKLRAEEEGAFCSRQARPHGDWSTYGDWSLHARRLVTIRYTEPTRYACVDHSLYIRVRECGWGVENFQIPSFRLIRGVFWLFNQRIMLQRLKNIWLTFGCVQQLSPSSPIAFTESFYFEHATIVRFSLFHCRQNTL